jgi:hypothetical protein
MTDPTDSTAATGKQLPAAQPESESPRRAISRHAGRLFGAAALLSTTALLPIIEPKAPPFKSD